MTFAIFFSSQREPCLLTPGVRQQRYKCCKWLKNVLNYINKEAANVMHYFLRRIFSIIKWKMWNIALYWCTTATATIVL